MRRIVIRRRRFSDYSDVTGLFDYTSEAHVLVDTRGHPVLWHIEAEPQAASFYVTYLEVVNEEG